ncbi:MULTISPECIES: hypothetical protein [Metallosphaera]|uniref:hypothetical protein n=1 Tax=Metallosphaera TaxID=41980 RepID=UPI001F061E6B|nr:hypothetical protein [Metallosphaera sedula]MCH1770287.1 hypothetical protein [Metallosphaera sedula]MCP6727879.1 hypothetical protein [Metallosphaera sedula]
MEIKEFIEGNKKTIILDEDLHRIVTFRIDRETNKRLEDLSAKLNVTKTKLILNMIMKFLAEDEQRRILILQYPVTINSRSIIGVRVSESLLSMFIQKVPTEYPYTVALRKIVTFYTNDVRENIL